jgi:DNA-binding transcriptional LysR family regulator
MRNLLDIYEYCAELGRRTSKGESACPRPDNNPRSIRLQGPGHAIRAGGAHQSSRVSWAVVSKTFAEERHDDLRDCIWEFPVRNEVFQATSLRTLIHMVAAELGITLMPQIAVASELASTSNVVIRPLSPDKPFRTLVLAWRPTTSRGAEFRMIGNLIRECLTGTKRAFAPDHDIEALAAR